MRVIKHPFPTVLRKCSDCKWFPPDKCPTCGGARYFKSQYVDLFLKQTKIGQQVFTKPPK